jgi:tripartite-type tricarboxylate transporter receptor subunit TctC
MFAAVATAQGTYPQRPIRVIVGYGAGSATDTMARILAERLAVGLAQSVVVENREGAGGAIGTATAAKAAPDGYTLLMGVPAMAVASHVQTPKPYDVVGDFTPIVKIAELPLLLITHPEAPYRTFKELIGYARSNPGKLSYATSGKGSPSHLGVELFRQFTGIDVRDVPYRNVGQAMTDTLSGQVSFYFPALSAGLTQVRAGKVRPLAIGAATRAPQLPDVPTVGEELGTSGLDIITWYGLFAPAGTPRAVIGRLHEESIKVMAASEVRERIARTGASIAVAGPEEFAAQVRADDAKYAKLVRDLGLKE